MYTKVRKLLSKDIKIDTLITNGKYFKSRHIPITKRVINTIVTSALRTTTLLNRILKKNWIEKLSLSSWLENYYLQQLSVLKQILETYTLKIRFEPIKR